MSADRVCPCPACGKWELREYHEIGMPEVEGDDEFTVDYLGECRGCGARYKFSTVANPATLRTR